MLADALRLPPLGKGARSAIREDPVEARIVRGTWRPPTEGEAVVGSAGKQGTWTKVTPGPDGAFEGEPFTGGVYLSFRVTSERERVAVLEASGHDFAYVNGELRPGDPYGHGFLELPVLLRAGVNEVLVRSSRGRFAGRLVEPPAEVFLLEGDGTWPELPLATEEDAGLRGPELAGVVVVNATRAPLSGWFVRARVESWDRPLGWRVPAIPALSARKVTVHLAPTVIAMKPGPVKATVELARSGAVDAPAVASMTRRVECVEAASRRVFTFASGIDGSVQTYAVTPRARPPAKGAVDGALVLSLHGASVEAPSQAAAYAPKSWATIVCPTNRRPFGFDWEDWGRLDAMEVLEQAIATIPHDPARRYLTGHSMGGHGTWHLGVTYPDRFAAVGPSAGWVSFFSYGGAPAGQEDPVAGLLRRAAGTSDTLVLATNLAPLGVYALHGDADDNVPVSEARAMVERLRAFHHDVTLFEQKGAGHWWDASDEPGADCVDWAPMFDLFARRRRPALAEVREVDFVTMNPGVSATSAWATIEAQERPLLPSRVRLRCDAGKRRFVGTVENVLALSLDVSHLPPGAPIEVRIEGAFRATVPWPTGAARITFDRLRGGWEGVDALGAGRKTPARAGPFKDAFRHRFQLVHGTRGTPEENAVLAAKARQDAELWWYRANGAVDVIADVDFEPRNGRDLSVVLYGNADTNAQWGALVGDGPVEVRRGSVRIGTRTIAGDDLACLFVRPRAGSAVGCVAVVAGTGVVGQRLLDRMPYLASGVGLPDVTVFGAEMLDKGAVGVRAAGFFGPTWGLDGAEILWR